ncbi:hypothetical protein KC19_VG079300 [Ceratodon purpureus]|uniref:Uncharacterized protein n=1 Tax=Ceratodon purpureus TaxID=3225 RepID=A0A8T0HMY3_CERPU|nr:hypothetical protein KC19_VG079300 [Ceratodon purpureus]
MREEGVKIDQILPAGFVPKLEQTCPVTRECAECGYSDTFPAYLKSVLGTFVKSVQTFQVRFIFNRASKSIELFITLSSNSRGSPELELHLELRKSPARA